MTAMPRFTPKVFQCLFLKAASPSTSDPGIARIATDIRIGTRVDRPDILPGEGNDHKVKRVQEILAKDSQ
jgi:hypothetical protein